MNHSNPYAQSDDSINPYAVPRAPSGLPPMGGTESFWREGKILVMHKHATLPDICIKSGEATNGFRLKRKLKYHHPAWAFTILFNVLLYLIMAAIVSKRATVMIGLSERWQSIRRRRILIGWSGALLGVGMLVAGLATLERGDNSPGGPVLLVLGTLAIISFAIYGMFGAKMVAATKIDEQLIYIKGAHPDFLAKLESVG
ncbi:hypothetical protein Poly51_01460 [Rubripirellula tenax]|uniref:Uncharacterized protein n=1 Tax=Rubripirellula tenax TaxID=2528015 RepID=A0A5C6FH18_9BACT|nr:hypothetical protein [Rubripirellula tenax]TWU59873.1 hypothetical protein Poly51_01460 [Rubripirellula tenax]